MGNGRFLRSPALIGVACGGALGWCRSLVAVRTDGRCVAPLLWAALMQRAGAEPLLVVSLVSWGLIFAQAADLAILLFWAWLRPFFREDGCGCHSHALG